MSVLYQNPGRVVISGDDDLVQSIYGGDYFIRGGTVQQLDQLGRIG